jgi:hypothetical protein
MPGTHAMITGAILGALFCAKMERSGMHKGTSKNTFSVIPAKAGIQDFQWLIDSRLRGNNDF